MSANFAQAARNNTMSARHNEDADRPRQETIGPFMTIDKGSNQLHYMTPPYAPHVQLSLERGARSGMDRTSHLRTATMSATSHSTASPRSLRSKAPLTKTLEPLASTPRKAPMSIVPSRYYIQTPAVRSSLGDKSVSRKNDSKGANEDPGRPRRETVGPFMTIDKGSNQLHYMKPPYAPHVQLNLERGARSGMDTSSRRRAGR